MLVAEQIGEAVAASAMPHGGADSGTVSISLGAASTAPDDGESAAVLLARAVAALYEAKRHGRNRTEARLLGQAPLEHVEHERL